MPGPNIYRDADLRSRARSGRRTRPLAARTTRRTARRPLRPRGRRRRRARLRPTPSGSARRRRGAWTRRRARRGGRRSRRSSGERAPRRKRRSTASCWRRRPRGRQTSLTLARLATRSAWGSRSPTLLQRPLALPRQLPLGAIPHYHRPRCRRRSNLSVRCCPPAAPSATRSKLRLPPPPRRRRRLRWLRCRRWQRSPRRLRHTGALPGPLVGTRLLPLGGTSARTRRQLRAEGRTRRRGRRRRPCPPPPRSAGRMNSRRRRRRRRICPRRTPAWPSWTLCSAGALPSCRLRMISRRRWSARR